MVEVGKSGLTENWLPGGTAGDILENRRQKGQVETETMIVYFGDR